MVLVLDRFVLVHNNYFLISLLEFEYDSKAFKNVKEKHCIISMFCPVRRIIKQAGWLTLCTHTILDLAGYQNNIGKIYTSEVGFCYVISIIYTQCVIILDHRAKKDYNRCMQGLLNTHYLVVAPVFHYVRVWCWCVRPQSVGGSLLHPPIASCQGYWQL